MFGTPFPQKETSPLYIFSTSHRWCACSVMSNSLQSHRLQPSRLLCPWDFPGKNSGVGCHFLLQGIFPTEDEPAPPMSLALAGAFVTTEPPGKPSSWHPIPLAGFLSWLSGVCLIPRSGRPPGGGHGNPLQFSPVFLPGESHGQRYLAGYGPQGHKEWTQLKRLSTSC